MSELDPEDTPPAGPQDSQSSDQSKGKLRQAWDAWTSRPENNAALLQFGIAALQPHSPGQSQLGALANAVGEGAGASDRNIAAQRAEADAEANRSVKDREAGARETTAKAYADQVAQGGSKTDKTGMQGRLRLQADFRKYIAKPDDTTGLTVDPVVAAVQKKFPDVKSKGDLLANPQAYAEAYKIFSNQVAEPSSEDGGDPTEATAPPSSTPRAQPSGVAPVTKPQPRIIYQQGTGAPFLWDGVPGSKPVPYHG